VGEFSFDFSHARMKIVFLLFGSKQQKQQQQQSKTKRLLAATGNFAGLWMRLFSVFSKVKCVMVGVACGRCEAAKRPHNDNGLMHDIRQPNGSRDLIYAPTEMGIKLHAIRSGT